MCHRFIGEIFEQREETIETLTEEMLILVFTPIQINSIYFGYLHASAIR